MKSALEHAAMIVEIIRAAGTTSRAIYQGELEGLHADMCADLGWHPRKWVSIGREMVKLPGVVRSEVRVEGSRLTFYEVEPADPAGNVVPLAEARRA